MTGGVGTSWAWALSELRIVVRPFLQFRGYFTSGPYNPFQQINPDGLIFSRLLAALEVEHIGLVLTARAQRPLVLQVVLVGEAEDELAHVRRIGA